MDVNVRTARDLGGLIRERRRALKLDQRTLAERVGVSRQWIIEVEKGKARAEVGLVLRTLEALGVRLTARFGDEPHEREAPPSIWVPDIDAIVESHRKRAR